MSPNPPPPAGPVSLQPGDLLGACRILGEVGRGSMGRVYRAEVVEEGAWGSVGTLVALKVLHPELAREEDLVRRFHQEGELGQKVRHPALARTLACVTWTSPEGGSEVGHPVMVQEFVEGSSLRGLLDDLGLLPEALLRDVAAAVGAGLAALHAGGVVHRDLKPENLLLTPRHTVKIIDLGVARVPGPGAEGTSFGRFLGSPAYAAPELFDGGDASAASDLYSLGVVLYELATGEQPFAGDSFWDCLRRHREKVLPPINQRRLNVSAFFATLVDELLDKEPGRRLPSAEELVRILEEGEEGDWWRSRSGGSAARRASPRGRIQVERETAVYGREGELQQLLDQVEAGRRGRGGVTLVTGEAGVGKSRLMDELAERLDRLAGEQQVLYGANDPAAAAADEGAVCRSLVSHLGREGLEERLAGLLDHPPELMRAFAQRLTGEASQAIDAQAWARLHRDLARALARRAPLVWIIEDLHFAGEEDGRLLPVLAGVSREAPVRLILTARQAELGPHRELVETLKEGGGLDRIEVGRLSARQVVDFLREILGSSTRAERLAGLIADRTDGNPFFMLEIVRQLRSEGSVGYGTPGGAEADLPGPEKLSVPASIASLVRRRLGGLAPRERDLLDVAAVQGYRFDPDLTARVLDRSRLAVLQDLARLERDLGLVRSREAGFRFDHHQLQEYLLEDLATPLAREYHARLADVLEEREGWTGRAPEEIPRSRLPRLAQHHVWGGEGRRARELVLPAVEVLLADLRCEDALRLTGLALDRFSAAETELRIRLLLARARALEGLHRREAQGEVLEEARALLGPEVDEALRGRVERELGRRLYNLGRAEEALDRYGRALDLARRSGDEELEAHILRLEALLRQGRAEPERVRKLLDRSEELCRKAGTAEGLAATHLNRATLLFTQGEYVASRRDYEAAAAHYRHHRGEDRLFLTLNGLTILEMHLRRLDRARPHMEELREVARRTGRFYDLAYVEGHLHSFAVAEGRWDEAREHGERFLEICREGNLAEGEIEATRLLGILDLLEGRHEEARARVEASRSRARERSQRFLEAESGYVLAELADAAGREEEASRLVTESLDRFKGLGSTMGLLRALLLRGRLRVEAGEGPGALQDLHEAEALIRSYGIAPLLALAEAWCVAAGEERDLPRPVEEAMVTEKAELHLLLHRLTGDERHRRQGVALLDRMGRHLSREGRRAFFRGNPLARRFGVEASEASS